MKLSWSSQVTTLEASTAQKANGRLSRPKLKSLSLHPPSIQKQSQARQPHKFTVVRSSIISPFKLDGYRQTPQGRNMVVGLTIKCVRNVADQSGNPLDFLLTLFPRNEGECSSCGVQIRCWNHWLSRVQRTGLHGKWRGTGRCQQKIDADIEVVRTRPWRPFVPAFGLWAHQRSEVLQTPAKTASPQTYIYTPGFRPVKWTACSDNPRRLFLSNFNDKITTSRLSLSASVSFLFPSGVHQEDPAH